MRRSTRARHQVALAVLALLAAGCAGVPSVTSPTSPDPAGSRTAGTSAAPSPSSPPQAASPLTSLAGYLAHRTGRVTAALYDRRTGRTWVLNGRLRQDTASIVKVQIMGAALRQAMNAGHPLPATEQALIPPMIENSDNNAATSMLTHVGGPSALRRFDLLAGLTHTTPSTLALIPGTDLPGWGLCTTTALDQVRLVSRFAFPNSILDSASRAYGLHLMEHVEADQGWGVSGGVTRPGVTVALKNGWLPLSGLTDWQINSIGWISGHGRDYVLAVMIAHNPTEAYGIQTIDTMANKIYAELHP